MTPEAGMDSIRLSFRGGDGHYASRVMRLNSAAERWRRASWSAWLEMALIGGCEDIDAASAGVNAGQHANAYSEKRDGLHL